VRQKAALSRPLGIDVSMELMRAKILRLFQRIGL
jgi:hypothetical protein